MLTSLIVASFLGGALVAFFRFHVFGLILATPAALFVAMLAEIWVHIPLKDAPSGFIWTIAVHLAIVVVVLQIGYLLASRLADKLAPERPNYGPRSGRIPFKP